MQNNIIPRILVVEDDPDMMEVITGTLKEVLGKDYEINKAVDGTQAYEMLEKNKKYSLLMIDYSMPVMNGLKLIKKIRGYNKLKNVPIIALSAVSYNADDMIAAGADYFIGKPFIFNDFAKKVKTALKI